MNKDEQQPLAIQTDQRRCNNLPDEARFLEHLHFEVERGKRFGSRFVVLRLRIDNPSQIDAERRERVLSEIGHLLRQSGTGFRGCDYVARLSNGHFAVVMPNTPLGGAMVKAERVRQSIASRPWHEIAPQSAPVSCAVAIAEYPGNAVDEDSILGILDGFLADETISNQVLSRPTDEVTEMSHGTLKLWARRLGWWTLISILPAFLFTYGIKPFAKRLFAVFIRRQAGAQRSWFAAARYEEDKDDFDGEFGTDTKSVLLVSGLGGDDDAREHAAAYMPTPRVLMKAMLDSLPVDPKEFVFVDAGCGKARTVLMASTYGFEKCIGVEFSPPLVRVAQKNCEIFAQQHDNLSPMLIECANVAKYRMPRKNLVVFLFNPFDFDILDSMMAELEDTVLTGHKVVIAWFGLLPVFFAKYKGWLKSAGKVQFRPGWTIHYYKSR